VRLAGMPTEGKREPWAYLNGEFLPLSQARISPLDRGFLLGDGIFETLRSYRGEPYFLDRHVRRLRASARTLNITGIPRLAKLCKVVKELLERSGLQDAYIRITLSRGTGGELGLVETISPTLFIFVRPLAAYPREWYRRGIKVVVSKVRRSADSPVWRLKVLSYLESLWAREEARKQGAQEALFLNTNGYVAEGATTNIFFVEGGELLTPTLQANILPGVTREVVLEICRDEGVPCQEGLFTLEDLERADEVFLTNSLMGVMPVGKVESARFRVSPRTVTSRIAREYAGLCSGDVLLA